MSGPRPPSDSPLHAILHGIVGVSRGRPEAIGLFGDTPQAFVASLVPLIVIPLLSSLMTHREFVIERFLLEAATSVTALLVPPVLTHALAVAWGREAAWLRFATAFNWCQFGLLMVAMFWLFVMGGRDAAVLAIGMLGLYALWMHWFLTRHGLGLSGGRSAILVLSVHMATSLVVLVPRFLAAMLRA